MAFVAEAALIALREGLEAFLIVGILLGFVMKLGRPDARRWVWLGLAAGVAASLLVGLLVQFFLLETFEERGGAEWFELFAALVAVTVLTYMVFWMWKHTRSLMAGLQKKIGDALSRNALGVVALLTFVSVLREGLEVVLFYGALAGRNAGFDLAWSGLLGAVLSVGIVVAILKTTLHFDLQRFFAVTGILLVFVAAGLLVHSVHAATSLGLLSPAPAVWDTSGFVGEDGAAGRILHALVGYTPQPTLLQALLYFGYLFAVGVSYLKSLGFYHRRPEATLRRGRAAATLLVILAASVATAWGAAHPISSDGHSHDHGDADIHGAEPVADGLPAMEAVSGSVPRVEPPLGHVLPSPPARAG